MFPSPRTIAFLGLCAGVLACGDSSITGTQWASMDQCSLSSVLQEYEGQAQDHEFQDEKVSSRMAVWGDSDFTTASSCVDDSSGESGSSEDGSGASNDGSGSSEGGSGSSEDGTGNDDSSTDDSSGATEGGTGSSGDDTEDSGTTETGTEDEGDDNDAGNGSNGSNGSNPEAGSGNPGQQGVICPSPFTPTSVESHPQDRNENGVVCEHDQGEAVMDDVLRQVPPRGR